MSVTLLGADGLPLQRAQPGQRLASSGAPYTALDREAPEASGWPARLNSADAEVNPWRDDLVARLREMVRNDGWASGAVTRLVDSVVGAELRPVPRPDFRSLSWWSPAFDASWAAEFASWAKGCWRDWANDPAKWCDLRRQQTVPEMFALGFRTAMVEGDALAVIAWRPERRATGRGAYATTVGLMEPDRLSNPQDRFDDERFRGGVEIDADGAALRYHFRDAHPGHFFASAKPHSWTAYPRETAWGRPVVVHYFEQERIEQHRGVGILAPVLAALRMNNRARSLEVQAAAVNAFLGAYIESPFDADLVQDALNPDAGLPAYQHLRQDFHAQNRVQLNGVRLPILAPGEKVNFLSPTRPNMNFVAFESAFLRNFASATGQADMEVSNDWSRTNYSSARAALNTAWRSVTRRRRGYSLGFCQPIYGAVLEEAMERDAPPMPRDAPPFAEARAAYTRADWRGPGRGYIDGVKEPTGAQLRMEVGMSTLDHECAENSGMDYEEVLDQRQIELAAFRSRGLPLPAWTGQVAAAAVGARDGREEETR